MRRRSSAVRSPTRAPCAKRRAAARACNPSGTLTAPLDKEQTERGKLGLCIWVPGAARTEEELQKEKGTGRRARESARRNSGTDTPTDSGCPRRGTRGKGKGGRKSQKSKRGGGGGTTSRKKTTQKTERREENGRAKGRGPAPGRTLIKPGAARPPSPGSDSALASLPPRRLIV